MTERNFKEEATLGFKKKSKVFFIIAGAVFGTGLIVVITFLTGMQSESEIADSPIGAAIGIGAMALIGAGVLAFLGYRNLKKSKDISAIDDQAKAIERALLEAERKEQLAEEKRQKELMLAEEKRQQELIRQQEELALVSPDFATTKVFSAGVNRSEVWLNQHTKQIQFLLPEQVNGETKLVKTKILSVDDLVSFDIETSQETVQDGHEHSTGGVIGGVGSSTFGGVGSSTKNSKTVTYTVNYYGLVLRFNDVDYPVIRVFYNNDKTTPETIIETLKLIQKK